MHENKKKNTYALKMKPGAVQPAQTPQTSVAPTQPARGKTSPSQIKSGKFITSKQMVFGDNKKLIPASYYQPH